MTVRDSTAAERDPLAEDGDIPRWRVGLTIDESRTMI
jgi:hypothetical protein